MYWPIHTKITCYVAKVVADIISVLELTLLLFSHLLVFFCELCSIRL